MVDTITSPFTQNLDSLPSLPQILLQILHTVSNELADMDQLAQIIQQDPAITARIMQLANSSFYQRNHRSESIEHAITYLGINNVKTLTITAAIKQYFNQFNEEHSAFMKRFWIRSLRCAQHAQVLAHLTGYHLPSEAYLSGLLVDLGQLLFLTSQTDIYLSIEKNANRDDFLMIDLEQQSFRKTHCHIGAEIIETWDLNSFIADAIRYHHHPIHEIQQSHHLVKVIHLASELSLTPEPTSLAKNKAHLLFGLNEDLISELCKRVNDDVKNIAISLNIELDNHQDEYAAKKRLGEKINEITLAYNLQLTRNNANNGHSDNSIKHAIPLILGIERYIFFTLDQENQLLKGYLSSDKNKADFVIDRKTNNIVNKAFNQQQTINSKEIDPHNLSIVDHQLIKYFKLPYLVAIPFSNDNQNGVFVTGSNEEILTSIQKNTALWKNSIKNIFPSSEKKTMIEEKIINETIHEINNPLSIINNYLEILSLKINNDQETTKEILTIKEEIDRVGKLLLTLKDQNLTKNNQSTNINKCIDDIVSILRKSLCKTKNISIKTIHKNEINEITINQGYFRQIIINLLKNAIESIQEHGEIVIETKSISIKDKKSIEITIQDNGPGIPEEILKNLFQPVASTKGKNNLGIGLSIVKRLIDEMNGSIIVNSNKYGTTFKLNLNHK